MTLITAEEARSLSNDNNSEIQKRKKELDEALESCMVKIHNAAKVGCFRVECHCRHDLFDEIIRKLRLGLGYSYKVSLDGMSLLSNRKQMIQKHSMIAFEVIWK